MTDFIPKEIADALADPDLAKKYKGEDKPASREQSTRARYFLSTANNHLLRAAEDIRLAHSRVSTAEEQEILKVMQRRLGEVQMRVNELRRKL